MKSLNRREREQNGQESEGSLIVRRHLMTIEKKMDKGRMEGQWRKKKIGEGRISRFGIRGWRRNGEMEIEKWRRKWTRGEWREKKIGESRISRLSIGLQDSSSCQVLRLV